MCTSKSVFVGVSQKQHKTAHVCNRICALDCNSQDRSHNEEELVTYCVNFSLI